MGEKLPILQVEHKVIDTTTFFMIFCFKLVLKVTKPATHTNVSNATQIAVIAKSHTHTTVCKQGMGDLNTHLNVRFEGPSYHGEVGQEQVVVKVTGRK